MIKGYKDDIYWAKRVEKCVEEGHTFTQAIQMTMYKRESYNIKIRGIAATIQKEDLSLRQMMQLHRQEIEELFKAYLVDDRENLKEEIMDVMQTLINLIDFLEIDLEEELIKHRLKLESRGREFKDNIIRIC